MTPYTARVLAPEEWPLMTTPELRTYLSLTRPEDTQVVVVEDQGRVIAQWAVLRIVHLEGLWIDPAYRNRVGVARRLLAMTLTVARRWAPEWVMTGADSAPIRRMLTRFGAEPVPAQMFLMSTRER